MNLEGIKDFTEELKFIIVFLVMCIFISMLFGQKVLYGFSWLILIGMIFVNWNKIERKLKDFVNI